MNNHFRLTDQKVAGATNAWVQTLRLTLEAKGIV